MGYLSAVRMAHAGLRLTLRFLQMVESRAIIILHCWGRGLFGGIGFVLKKCHLVFVLRPCVIDNALRFPWGMYEIGFVFLTSIRVVGGAETKRRRFDIVYNFPEWSLQLFPGTRMEHVGPVGPLGVSQMVESRPIIILHWRGRGLFGEIGFVLHFLHARFYAPQGHQYIGSVNITELDTAC